MNNLNFLRKTLERMKQNNMQKRQIGHLVINNFNKKKKKNKKKKNKKKKNKKKKRGKKKEKIKKIKN